MFGLVAMSVFCAATELGATEQFLLEEPGEPTLNSGAVITGGALIITAAKGRRFSYERRRDLDDANGSFLGFYCREAEQHLRWPAGGRGTMHLGQVNRGVVRWRESRMRVRAVGGRPTTVRRPVQDTLAPSETVDEERDEVQLWPSFATEIGLIPISRATSRANFSRPTARDSRISATLGH